jgi:hypothetical protein
MSPVPDPKRNPQATATTTSTGPVIKEGHRISVRLAGLRHPAEILRVAGSAAAGFIALLPFLHDGIIGGDDGKWYTSVVADFLQQWRMGLGPVFVGQTRFAAIGTVLPLRITPYLQHLTLALDFATGRRLSPYLLLNLAVLLSGTAAGLSAYLCLRSILPSRRPEAMLLAVLYVWCPGVVGLPYTGQLFMSTMTLPFIPIVFAGIVRIFGREDFTGWAMVSTGCAACWLAHSPIAIWVSLSVALAIAVRWVSGVGWTGSEGIRTAAAGLLFLGLSGYVFISIWVLNPSDIGSIPRDVLLENLKGFFPALLLPVTRNAENVTDLQLGWSLYAIAGVASVFAWATRDPAARAIAIVTLLLVFLTLPVPHLTDILWKSIPQAVINATNAVPTQRLIAILAGCTTILAAVVLSTLRQRRIWALLVLGIGVAWSGLELRKFVRRGHLISNSKAASEVSLKAENLLPTRFSLGLLSYDNLFFSNGLMDNELEQRVLAGNLRSYIVSNVRTIAPGDDFGRRSLHPALPGVLKGTSQKYEHVWVDLAPRLTLLPGKHYLLAIEVATPAWVGILQLKGIGFYREYQLPTSGMPFSFGSAELNSRVIPLFTESTTPVELTLAFINQDPNADMSQFQNFGHFDLLPYDPNSLPIRLRSLVPYLADVHSPEEGWLETFRYFTRGWTATVNGQAARVRRSPNGLVAVPIPAGDSQVKLVYRPPTVLLTAYWLTWATWTGLILVALRHSRRGSFSWADSGARPTLHPS